MKNEQLIAYKIALRVLHNIYYQPPNRAWLTTLNQSKELFDWPSSNQKKTVSTIIGAIESEGLGAIEREHYRLFIGPGKVPCYLWGSVYTDKDNLLCGKTNAQFKAFCLAHGITLSVANSEPWDHIALQFAVLAEFIEIGDLAAAKILLAEHIMPWTLRLFELIQEHTESDYHNGWAILANDTLRQLAVLLKVQPISVSLFY